MRAGRGHVLEAHASPQEVAEHASAARIAAYGPKCAAWLVRTARKEVRAHGVTQFHVYVKKLAEAYEKRAAFFIAFDYLKGRRKWHGTVETVGARRVYRLFWLGSKRGRVMAGLSLE